MLAQSCLHAATYYAPVGWPPLVRGTPLIAGKTSFTHRFQPQHSHSMWRVWFKWVPFWKRNTTCRTWWQGPFRQQYCSRCFQLYYWGSHVQECHRNQRKLWDSRWSIVIQDCIFLVRYFRSLPSCQVTEVAADSISFEDNSGDTTIHFQLWTSNLDDVLTAEISDIVFMVRKEKKRLNSYLRRAWNSDAVLPLNIQNNAVDTGVVESTCVRSMLSINRSVFASNSVSCNDVSLQSLTSMLS